MDVGLSDMEGRVNRVQSTTQHQQLLRFLIRASVWICLVAGRLLRLAGETLTELALWLAR